MADFFRTIGSTDEDEMQEEVVTADVKEEVAKVEATHLDDKKDYVVVPAGKQTVNFSGLDSYKRKVDPTKAVKAYEQKVKNNQGKVVDKEQEKGAARTRGAR